MYGLVCADCGLVALTIERAAEHEAEFDEMHGGWDTVLLTGPEV